MVAQDEMHRSRRLLYRRLSDSYHRELRRACAALRRRRAGTGYSVAVAAMLRGRLDKIVATRRAVAGARVKGAVWVAPDLRAKVTYLG